MNGTLLELIDRLFERLLFLLGLLDNFVCYLSSLYILLLPLLILVFHVYLLGLFIELVGAAAAGEGIVLLLTEILAKQHSRIAQLPFDHLERYCCWVQG